LPQGLAQREGLSSRCATSNATQLTLKGRSSRHAGAIVVGAAATAAASATNSDLAWCIGHQPRRAISVGVIVGAA